MKRKIFFIVAGVALIIIMTGCPYESPVSLSDSCNSTIDPGLIGTWVYQSGDGKKDTLLIMKFDEHEYYIESHEKNKDGEKVTNRGRGFITLINGQKIINFCDLAEPGKFYFGKYEISGNMMKFFSPSDNFIKVKFTSGQELLDYFKKKMKDKGFYEPADTAVRLK